LSSKKSSAGFHTTAESEKSENNHLSGAFYDVLPEEKKIKTLFSVLSLVLLQNFKKVKEGI